MPSVYGREQGAKRTRETKSRKREYQTRQSEEVVGEKMTEDGQKGRRGEGEGRMGQRGREAGTLTRSSGGQQDREQRRQADRVWEAVVARGLGRGGADGRRTCARRSWESCAKRAREAAWRGKRTRTDGTLDRVCTRPRARAISRSRAAPGYACVCVPLLLPSSRSQASPSPRCLLGILSLPSISAPHLRCHSALVLAI